MNHDIATGQYGAASKPALALSSADRSLAIILDEHESLRLVLNAMQAAVQEAAEKRAAIDCGGFRLMLHYLASVPNNLHHPKEDAHLFPLLRQRAEHLGPVLDDLGAQHASEQRWLARIEDALNRFEAGNPCAFSQFATLVAQYCSDAFEHLRLEETVVFVAARETFTDGDWTRIAAEFGAHGDSRFAAEEKRQMVLRGKIARL